MGWGTSWSRVLADMLRILGFILEAVGKHWKPLNLDGMGSYFQLEMIPHYGVGI